MTERPRCLKLPGLIAIRRWSMFRYVLILMVLAVGVALVTPADAQSPRVWTQVDGTVLSIEATRLMLKTDLGVRLPVDISSMSTADRKELARGQRISLIGYTAPRSGEFMAWFVPAEREEPVAQASPPTTPPTTPAPVPVPGR